MNSDPSIDIVGNASPEKTSSRGTGLIVGLVIFVLLIGIGMGAVTYQCSTRQKRSRKWLADSKKESYTQRPSKEAAKAGRLYPSECTSIIGSGLDTSFAESYFHRQDGLESRADGRLTRNQSGSESTKQNALGIGYCPDGSPTKTVDSGAIISATPARSLNNAFARWPTAPVLFGRGSRLDNRNVHHNMGLGSNFTRNNSQSTQKSRQDTSYQSEHGTMSSLIVADDLIMEHRLTPMRRSRTLQSASSMRAPSDHMIDPGLAGLHLLRRPEMVHSRQSSSLLPFPAMGHTSTATQSTVKSTPPRSYGQARGTARAQSERRNMSFSTQGGIGGSQDRLQPLARRQSVCSNVGDGVFQLRPLELPSGSQLPRWGSSASTHRPLTRTHSQATVGGTRAFTPLQYTPDGEGLLSPATELSEESMAVRVAICRPQTTAKAGEPAIQKVSIRSASSMSAHRPSYAPVYYSQRGRARRSSQPNTGALSIMASPKKGPGEGSRPPRHVKYLRDY